MEQIFVVSCSYNRSRFFAFEFRSHCLQLSPLRQQPSQSFKFFSDILRSKNINAVFPSGNNIPELEKLFLTFFERNKNFLGRESFNLKTNSTYITNDVSKVIECFLINCIHYCSKFCNEHSRQLFSFNLLFDLWKVIMR